VKNLLHLHQEKLKEMAVHLVKKETLSADEIKELIGMK
jgi:ATP-dependent Zn protease